MVNLLELCKNLQQKIEKLEAKIEKLEAEIENLKAENKALKIENAELKESKFKKLIPAQLKRAIQNKKGQAKKSERNVGGQVGTMAIIELK